MVFTDVRLQNYRSYIDSSFELEGGVSIVVGPNGAGKSNLIESLLLCAAGTLYRGKNGIINHTADWARIDVHTADNTTRTVKITSVQDQEKPKINFAIDEKGFTRLGSKNKQPAVLFEPNNLLLLHGEPNSRREYLNDFSAQISGSYQAALLKYKRSLAQRNALLKKPELDKSQLFVWNIRLSELAEAIVKQRVETIGLINQKLGQTYSNISRKPFSLELEYKSPLPAKNYSANLLKKLDKELELDRARGFTGAGPHREDFTATIDARPVSQTASRGETRTLLLALKIIELEVLEEKTGKKPLLLLDDVFSELDGSRRKALTNFLKKYQTIITTTDADLVIKNFSQNCQIIPL